MQVSSYLFQSPYSQAVQVGRPDPLQEQKQAAEEEAAKSKESSSEKQSQQSKNEAIKINSQSSTMYQNDSSSKSTTQAVNAFLDVAKDVRRSEYINTYSSN
jgi:hypothetical protein